MKLCAGACLVLVAFLSTTAQAEIVYWARSDGTVEPVDTENPGPHVKTAGTPVTLEKANGITFNVTYTDVNVHNGIGFDDPVHGADRRARITDILNYLNAVLNETGACDILFEQSVVTGTGALAEGGTFFQQVTGFINGYAYTHITTGVAPSATVPDIDTTVDFGWPWYQGTGTTPNTMLDFQSAMLHEFTHGLGFLSLSSISGSSDIDTGLYTVWDSLLQTGTGKVLFSGNPPAFRGVTSDLVGAANGVVFAGANARAAFGSNPPVFTPKPFEVGSSLSHWDPSVPGVMAPAIGNGEMIRRYSSADLGAIEDLGYKMGAGPANPLTAFTADVTFGAAPLTVHFTDQSMPGAQPIDQWSWDFGDSATSTVQDPTHVYALAGTYSVTLTVTSPAGSDTLTKNAYITATGLLTVTPSAGSGGTISPSTPVSIPSGGSQTFAITPDTGYHVASVLVDGMSIGAVTSYRFTGVLSGHTISATFASNTAPAGCPGGTTSSGTPATTSANIFLLCLTCAILLAPWRRRVNGTVFPK